MDFSPFAQHFPITFSHFDTFVRGMPHEKFSRKNSKKGKKACQILLMRKLVHSPISITFLTSYSLFLTTLKVFEVAGRTFTLMHPTKAHVKGFILACKQATDYLLLTFIMPVRIIAEIIKLSVAMFFGSHLYFSHPKTYPTSVQMEYYQKNTDRKFYQFRFSRSVTLQIKAEIREIEHVHEKIFSELVNNDEKISFLKNIIRLLKKINNEKIDSTDLDALREFCLEVAEENDIKVVFKTPQKDYSSSIISLTSTIFSDASSNFFSCNDSEISNHKSLTHS